MTTKVSIIIPVYNCEKYIRQCIDSCLLQTYDNIEIIVVNDGSTDDTQKIIRSYEGVGYIGHTQNRGTAFALNDGIKHAKGEWIKWVSADDVLTNNAVEILVDNALRTPDNQNVIFYTDYWYIDKNGTITGEFIERNLNNLSQNERNQLLWQYFYGNGSSSLMHKSIFERVGMYDDSLKASEDYEFWLRACLVYNVRLYLIQQKTLYYRRHDDQLTHKMGGYYDSIIREKIQKMLDAKNSTLPC